jgi:hypothetical protein
MTLVATQSASPHDGRRAAISGRDKVCPDGTQCHALCARCCMLQAVSIKALSSVVRSSSALGLSACPRSRTQDAPPHTISILPHAERTRKYPHCIVPLAAPRLGVLTLSSVTSSPPARSWRRPGRPTLPLSCCLLPCSQGVCTAAINRRRSLARRTSAAVDTGDDLLARPFYRTFSCLRFTRASNICTVLRSKEKKGSGSSWVVRWVTV